jgi:anti-anti-sigma factor
MGLAPAVLGRCLSHFSGEAAWRIQPAETTMIISSRTPEGRSNHCAVCNTDLVIDPSHHPGDAPCPRCGHLLWFTCQTLGDTRIIKLTGDLTDTDWLDRLVASIAIPDRVRLVIDLDDIAYLSSDSLARFINLKRKVTVAQGKLTLRNVAPGLREVFRITRLDQVLEIED